MVRIAVIERSKCINGKGCNFICANVCPVNRGGEDCIILKEDDNKPLISETLCIGCGICIKRCPTECISVLNLPEKLEEDPVHRFGENMFEFFRLPIPKKGMVVGIIGRNGIGKSSALNILSGELVPNSGDFNNKGVKESVIERYKGSILGDYFKALYDGKIKVSYKPQRIELIPKVFDGTVKELLDKVDETGDSEEFSKKLDLEKLWDRDVKNLSGGELQKLAIIAAACKKADFYFFDEPASFLDVTTRIKAARLISGLKEKGAVMVVEHDLATLDYISDEMQIVYGEASVYGVFSQSKGVRRGINEYLDGYLPDDNVRFRDYSIKFSLSLLQREVGKDILFEFPSMKKSFDKFSLDVNEGCVKKGEVLAIMGANGLGKTTFLKLITGLENPDNKVDFGKVKIAYKTQYPSSDVEGTVMQLLQEKAGNVFHSGWYRADILDKLGIGKILNNEIKNLSGGELQKFYVALTLSDAEADIFAFDEPSAFVDVEDRLKVAEVIKDFVIREEKAAIVVDHDVQFIDYLGDSMLVFEGEPGVKGKVFGPCEKREGMNRVLKMLNITYRRDKESGRPRINKPNSQLDAQQRAKGEYYYV